MSDKQKTPLGQSPVVEVIGYLDERAPFPVGSLILAILCFLYLLNLTAGGIIPLEIPDVIPGVGNLDEGVAGVLLAWSILNIVRWAKVRRAQRQARQGGGASPQAMAAIEGPQSITTAWQQPLAQPGAQQPTEEVKEQR